MVLEFDVGTVQSWVRGKRQQSFPWLYLQRKGGP